MDSLTPGIGAGRDLSFQEDIQIALALSLSGAETKKPRPNINPNSRSATALAKEEERQVQEAIQQSLAEGTKATSLLDRELLPPLHGLSRRLSASPQSRFSVGRGGISPFLRNDIDPSDLPELV
uniref:Uncharacterized protein n=1 Tax=Odontella aurita TaxID=265563 RepID=A0A6U6JNH9_9STRA|mmetsp:Transcript_58136/g.173504  ORF Transcript_58136/g.173504 Transcript_58136/m.173504 type:complete len:124 (+) Transcript_58136:245-616(+)